MGIDRACSVVPPLQLSCNMIACKKSCEKSCPQLRRKISKQGKHARGGRKINSTREIATGGAPLCPKEQ